MADYYCDISQANASSRTVMIKGQTATFDTAVNENDGSSNFGENAGFDNSLSSYGNSHFYGHNFINIVGGEKLGCGDGQRGIFE